jgi:hypothetical protein
MAIVSGALRREIELVLARAGLARYFELIIAAEDVPDCKPDPAGFNQARAALKAAPVDCMVIEDSLPGLKAARGAGLRCAMLATSHHAEVLAGADSVWADFTGRSPADLPGPTAVVEISLTAEGLERVRSVPLVHRMPAAVFSIAGPGALQCMQGLLTNDLVKPADGRWSTAHCSHPRG